MFELGENQCGAGFAFMLQSGKFRLGETSKPGSMLPTVSPPFEVMESPDQQGDQSRNDRAEQFCRFGRW
jgi:hypothetical protein